MEVSTGGKYWSVKESDGDMKAVKIRSIWLRMFQFSGFGV